jgi:signal transduction histidine kinase
LLSDEVEDSLSILVDRVAALADADLVCVAIPAGPGSMVIQIARGALAEQVQGTEFEAAGTLAGRANESRQPVLSDVDSENRIHPAADLGPTMALPLMSTAEPSGVLTVSRLPGRARFTRADLDMAADFASQASVALRLSAAQRDRQRVALLEDRGRIARDLHDHVIQRLFGAGLSLQAIAKSIPDSAAGSRVTDQVDVLDAAIAEIRTAIFTITTPTNSDRSSIRHRIIDLVAETSELFANSPQVSFVGPVDLLVAGTLADDVVAVVREGLTNVARHASAHHTTVAVGVADQLLSVVITDDGVGVDPSTAGVSSGTANLLRRAQSRGGTFAIAKREPSGTSLTWTARLDQPEVSS